MRFVGSEQQSEWRKWHNSEGVDEFVTGAECNWGLSLRFVKGGMVEVPFKKTVLVATFKTDCRIAWVQRNLQDVCGIERRKKGRMIKTKYGEKFLVNSMWV